uniref:Uncharacterized protein n=1 Tax=Opuntia streptacantha TaxID=393608 RepID=A0A7C8Z816_OPUST
MNPPCFFFSASSCRLLPSSAASHRPFVAAHSSRRSASAAEPSPEPPQSLVPALPPSPVLPCFGLGFCRQPPQIVAGHCSRRHQPPSTATVHRQPSSILTNFH